MEDRKLKIDFISFSAGASKVNKIIIMETKSFQLKENVCYMF
jgi:hypothetical protein